MTYSIYYEADLEEHYGQMLNWFLDEFRMLRSEVRESAEPEFGYVEELGSALERFYDFLDVAEDFLPESELREALEEIEESFPELFF
ncbi:MAG: hypothetical protein ACTSU5_14965 [Promethearchaeota archaeon]